MRDTEIQILQKDYEDNKQAYYIYALSLVGRSALAEDIIHGVYVNVIKREFLPECLKHYLLRAIRNGAMDVYREAKKERSLFELTSDRLTAAERELYEHVDFHLNMLDEKNREVLILKIYEDMTFCQIAEITGETINTVCSRYRRSLAKLRDIIK